MMASNDGRFVLIVKWLFAPTRCFGEAREKGFLGYGRSSWHYEVFLHQICLYLENIVLLPALGNAVDEV